MRWLSALSRKGSLSECLEELDQVLGTQPDSPDFLAVFASPEFDRSFPRLLQQLRQKYPTAMPFGCSARGLIGDGQEAEYVTGVSLTLGWLPGVKLKFFHAERETLPDLDASPQQWREALVGDDEQLKGILLLAEPFSFPADGFLAGLDYAYPGVTKVGGLASGGQTAGSTRLLSPHGILASGVLGVGFFGDVEVDAVVAQGCRPIGKPMVVTDCSYNEIATLDGRVAGDAVLSILRMLPERDQRLARQALFVGIGAGGPKLDYRAGDFLIRQVLGVDPEEHSLVVNGTLRKGQVVQLHLRDGRSSSEDVETMLERYRTERPDSEAKGGLLFSCLGRGRSLYGHADHDSNLFRTKLGALPLGGFFCNGEFGPVGGVTSLHGFTSCFAVFSEVASPSP
jgi:small ligand-binding sensory domain FIST